MKIKEWEVRHDRLALNFNKLSLKETFEDFQLKLFLNEANELIKGGFNYGRQFRDRFQATINFKLIVEKEIKDRGLFYLLEKKLELPEEE